MEIALRDYQIEAQKTFFNKLILGVKRQLIVLPTGAGKTIVAASISKLFRDRYNNGLPIVFIAHRHELLKQTAEKMKLVWGDVKVGKVKGVDNEQEADVIVASTQTLIRGRQMVKPGLVIYDEAHHSVSKGSMKVLESLGCFEADGPPLLGITATPNRLDRQALGQVYEEIVLEKSILDLILARYLCDVRGKKIVIDELDLQSVETMAGDYNEKQLGEQMGKESVIDTIVQAYLEHGESRKTIVFAVNVKQAYDIAEGLAKYDVRAKAIDGSLPEEARSKILQEFSTGVIQVLVNCMILTEGFDEPSVSCILMARPTKSESLYIQCIGRGTRLYPDKMDCLVLDVVGVTEDHSLMTLSNLFPPGRLDLEEEEEEELDLFLGVVMEEGESVVEFHERLKQIAFEYGKKMREINLFSTKTIYLWNSFSDRAYYISIGNQQYCYLIKEEEHWWIIFENQNKQLYPLHHEPLSLEYAQGIAENFLSNIKTKIILKEARWRNLAMSPAQRDQLERNRIDYDQGWTKGQASDALNDIYGRRVAAKVIHRFNGDLYRSIMSNSYLKEKINEELLCIQSGLH
ncbi:MULTISPECIES: DEAD/DEAH box helicase [Paenibacillus]|uniref:DEAD/DEAH box helicase n=1 Tax=Paenibacillus vandeheii TaxID=3035917 RepID=A0ABT8JFQ4_9BACL|nr:MULTISPECIES: DEAD/DEAH box helicase [Paenibacillus]KGP81978.1 hypothetical protein P364_0114260 [Paenibacillus sp. MAEPY2]KGP86064.1 hypothetical protein P363_0119735 [Paenibacillus sp. MAEPY1]MDN4603897.1 DEAD/DEAH box helicase [Paenibacillus vandeheii]